ncbi:hypothetical protein EDC01DRAFT_343147 [Geopyxis carbonaria]|nr:hypothetical protein EDC01DRAFT_343147 [Geopyxis carbonaria]
MLRAPLSFAAPLPPPPTASEAAKWAASASPSCCMTLHSGGGEGIYEGQCRRSEWTWSRESIYCNALWERCVAVNTSGPTIDQQPRCRNSHRRPQLRVAATTATTSCATAANAIVARPHALDEAACTPPGSPNHRSRFTSTPLTRWRFTRRVRSGVQ